MPYPFLDTTNDYSPINDLQPVTPSDSTDLPNGVSRGLLFTTSGNVTFITAKGTQVTIPVNTNWFGAVQFIRAKRILATGTTSTGIFACY